LALSILGNGKYESQGELRGTKAIATFWGRAPRIWHSSPETILLSFYHYRGLFWKNWLCGGEAAMCSSGKKPTSKLKQWILQCN
jgi:hypothetical protein